MASKFPFVDEGVEHIAQVEKDLERAVRRIRKLEKVWLEAYKASVINGTRNVVDTSRMVKAQGYIGAALVEIYELHAGATETLKQIGADVPLEYPTLEGVRPKPKPGEPQPRSGGDR